MRGGKDVLTAPGLPDMTKEEFWKGIRVKVETRRLELGWDQKDLAEHSGVSRATISNFLAGHTKELQWDTLRKISGAFRDHRPHAPAAWVSLFNDPESLPATGTG